MTSRERRMSSKGSFKAWNDYILSIPRPPIEKLIWGSEYSKLSILLVEPRNHEWLQGILYNICHIYGGTEVQLYVFHGIDNYKLVREITKDFENVNFFNLNINDFQPYPYEHSKYFCSNNLWDKINSEFVLTITTTSLLRKKIEDFYFNFSYTGAPWKNGGVGNGGFSLRKTKDMVKICEKVNYEKRFLEGFILEDIFLVGELIKEGKKICDYEMAKKFSVETVYFEDPIGCHAPHRYHDNIKLKPLMIEF